MTETLTQQDLAQVAKLLERLRTGELRLIDGQPAKHHEAPAANVSPLDTYMQQAHQEFRETLQRVEAYLLEGIQRMDAPIGNPESAFPVQDLSKWQCHGMALRDYFAAKAMQSLVLATQTMTHVTPEDVVGEAYHYADRMLEARELL